MNYKRKNYLFLKILFGFLSVIMILFTTLSTVSGKTSTDILAPDYDPTGPFPLPLEYTYDIVNVYPHDPDAFTQGLLYHDGFLYESTGRYGQSSLRKVDPTSGEVLQMISLEPQFFGEGLALYEDQLYQLTWKSRLGFIYDLNTFELTGYFNFDTEGWGLSIYKNNFIQSDGSNHLFLYQQGEFQPDHYLEVTNNQRPVEMLNELEVICDIVFANIWQTREIAMISPVNGMQFGTIDTEPLFENMGFNNRIGVANGIAWNQETNSLYVTGKNWPALFELSLSGFCTNRSQD